MIVSTLGLIPAKSGIYQIISTYFLPAALFLLLLCVDIPAILKLGKMALLMMFAGSFGIVFGAPIVLILFQKWLPADAWMGFGALSGSWVGGSANMIAVKEAIQAPEAIFLPMIAVDIVVSYSWMGFLILLAAYQTAYDRWNRSDTRLIDELNRRASNRAAQTFRGYQSGKTVFLLLLAILATGLSIWFSKLIPEAKGFSAATWTILFVSALGIAMSFTPLKKLQSYGASKIGYIILYFVLTSIGAKANLAALMQAPVFILAGFVWVLIHFLFMILIAKFIRAPLALTAAASQANIGGPVSAPIVAAIYQPSLAPVGLLLGVLGNIIGTYAGLFCSQLCHWTIR